MAALPYMPLFVADYLADAAHLTTTQHGAYLLLIMNYWQRGGPLPDDDRRLASITRLGPREWARNRSTLEEFFTLTHGAWVHNRIDHELARVADKSLKSKRAAQASVERRFSERSTPVEPTDTDNKQIQEKEEGSGGKPPTGYAFFGQVVRLTPQHFDRWQKAYSAIPDLKAELNTIDAWWKAQETIERKQWFYRTASMLNRKHQEILTAKAKADTDEDGWAMMP